MSIADFDVVTPLVLKSEGGFVDNKRDPGGATNRGCTLAECRAVYGSSFNVAELRLLSVAQATDIFRRYYWNKISGDRLPAGVDYALYDYSVNSGVSRATRVACSLAQVPGHSSIDTNALAAFEQYDEASFIDAICDERLAFMRSLTREWPEFGNGWTARVLSVRTRAKRLAIAASVPHAPSPVLDSVVPHDPTPKAKLAPPRPGKTAGVTAGAAVIAAAVPEHAGHLGFGVVAPAVVVGIGALVWGIVHSDHADASTEPATTILPALKSPRPR